MPLSTINQLYHGVSWVSFQYYFNHFYKDNRGFGFLVIRQESDTIFLYKSNRGFGFLELYDRRVTQLSFFQPSCPFCLNINELLPSLNLFQHQLPSKLSCSRISISLTQPNFCFVHISSGNGNKESNSTVTQPQCYGMLVTCYFIQYSFTSK